MPAWKDRRAEESRNNAKYQAGQGLSVGLSAHQYMGVLLLRHPVMATTPAGDWRSGGQWRQAPGKAAAGEQHHPRLQVPFITNKTALCRPCSGQPWTCSSPCRHAALILRAEIDAGPSWTTAEETGKRLWSVVRTPYLELCLVPNWASRVTVNCQIRRVSEAAGESGREYCGRDM
ncbi:hypothetical protein K402DRAFT_95819 [Aulographum hederae CBS 113979]|uniref:Uncharacterized protein n=1 Tax=Aulographum hederae CBS 113979 TaxID=1176131 RepID=A0A6G1GYA8_9PEZI|nr:hypothetical protein K402DRAFT_95819 [Aulographum hederae CBS 113979]